MPGGGWDSVAPSSERPALASGSQRTLPMSAVEEEAQFVRQLYGHIPTAEIAQLVEAMRAERVRVGRVIDDPPEYDL
jgi:hypothetical protein